MSSFYDSLLEMDRPYIIAELGSNHNGDMDLARKLINAAKEAGADCVKFQSWSKETIFSRKVYNDNYFLKDDYRNRDDYTLEEIVEEFSISEKELIEMKEHCDKVGIACSSTPFSWKEADFLVEVLKPPFIKVASMDLNNYPFLEYMAKKGLPMIVSTGLSDLSEIDKAIATIEAAGNNEIAILHCVSNYPPRDEQVNLRNMNTLKRIYNKPIGFSDHTIGISIPLAAAARGAKIIEKHFTLDKQMFGWDHKVSASPEEMEMICSESKRICVALGNYRIKSTETVEQKSAFRRSIVSMTEIKAGEIIKREDVDFKRPGDGIAPEFIDWVVGRTAAEDIPKDMPIRKDQLK